MILAMLQFPSGFNGRPKDSSLGEPRMTFSRYFVPPADGRHVPPFLICRLMAAMFPPFLICRLMAAMFSAILFCRLMAAMFFFCHLFGRPMAAMFKGISRVVVGNNYPFGWRSAGSGTPSGRPIIRTGIMIYTVVGQSPHQLRTQPHSLAACFTSFLRHLN